MRVARRRPMAEINVVPYIDVMLVLLVIFMMTTPLLAQGVKVDLPQAAAKQIQAKTQPIIVSVNAQGQYFLNIAAQPQAAIDQTTLEATVSAALDAAKADNKTTPQVLVKADQSVAYGKVMQAMVWLQQAGAASVGLVTQRPDRDRN